MEQDETYLLRVRYHARFYEEPKRSYSNGNIWCVTVCVTTKRVKCVNRINVSFAIFISYISIAKQSVAVIHGRPKVSTHYTYVLRVRLHL